MLIDIFKVHQKAIKHLLQKENMFASLLVDGYKVYVEGKLERLPDNVVVLDAAIKLCQCEIVLRKNNGKPGVEPVSESAFLNSLKMFPSLANLSNLSSGNIANNPTTNVTVTKADEVTSTTTTTTTTTATGATTATFTSTSASLTSTSVFAVPSVTASAVSTLNLHSSSSRPRGRPPGSKNSLSKSLDWNQPKMNPATMAAMLGIYSNPSMQSQYSNPAQVSALLEEFYKLQASISPTSILSPLENVNVSSAMFTPPPPPKSFNSTATSKFPKYNMKGSIPTSTAVAPNPTSTVISVGSGQLTITPSSYTSSKGSKNTRPNQNPLICDGVDFDIESVIPKSELLTNKMFTEMSSTTKIKSSMQPPSASNMTIPKDLPKSLTITPAPAGYAGYTGKPTTSNPHVTVHPEHKKQKKSHKRSTTAPGRIPNFTQKPTGLYGDVLTEYQQLLLSQMNMMSRNMVPNPMYKPTQFQPTSSKPKTQSFNKKEQKSAKALPFPMGAKNMLSDAKLPTMSNTSSRNFQPTTFRGNQPTSKNQQAHLVDSPSLKFGTTPMTAHSPNKSPVLPPPIARQPSPAMHQARYCSNGFNNS